MRFLTFFALLMLITSCAEGRQKLSGGCAVPQLAQSDDVDCGYLSVPENRNNPDSREIKLAYVVLKATNSTAKKDPIVYLQGGPGGATLPMAGYFANTRLRRDRDFILMDQRGTGASHAMCADLGDQLLSILAMDLSPEEELAELEKAAEACKRSMRADGVDQAGYNTIENAQDLDDLRKALGYDQWNLFGGSYGSRLALAYMRDFPEHSRSAVMSGMFPVQVNLYESLISNLRASLFRVFDTCAADSDCNKRYPDLQKTFFETLTELKNNPLTFTWWGKPFTLNAQDMLLLVQQLLYTRDTYQEVPAFISGIKKKNERILRQAVQPLAGRARLINFAMNWSLNAHDEVTFAGNEMLQADLDANAELKPGPAFFMSDPSILENWHPFRAPAYVNEPVVSDIPSFVANGAFDPITPPANALETTKYLKNSFYVEFPWEGHSVFGDCYFRMVEAFLNDPSSEPDSACATRKVRLNWN